jgi:hypothetical protein
VTRSADKKFEVPVWLKPDGEPVSCYDKIKVLNENLEEIRQMCQDALEDGILMECDETQLRTVLKQMVESLENPYVDPKKD